MLPEKGFQLIPQPTPSNAATFTSPPFASSRSKVTLSIYTDACYPKGPGDLLVSAEATVASNSCDLAVAKIRNGPSLVQGTKYWITATTTSQQSALDSRWYASNNAQAAVSFGDGWIQSTVFTPAFAVQGRENVEMRAAATTRQTFGSNLFIDPCTGCNYDPNAGGFDVRGPDNCTLPGQTNWFAAPFVATRTGIPQRILAPIILKNPTSCPQNKVTLSIYTDNCGEGPGSLLVSAEATAQTEPCRLAVAKLRNAPSLTKNVKYWVTATTTADQAALDASWFASNNAQIADQLGFGWSQFSAGLQLLKCSKAYHAPSMAFVFNRTRHHLLKILMTRTDHLCFNSDYVHCNYKKLPERSSHRPLWGASVRGCTVHFHRR